MPLGYIIEETHVASIEVCWHSASQNMGIPGLQELGHRDTVYTLIALPEFCSEWQL